MADFWNTDNWSQPAAAAAAAVAAAANNCCDIAGCIVAERRPAECTLPVLRECPYRSAEQAPDLLVHLVDTESVGFAASTEAQWVSQAPDSAPVAAEDERSDRDTAARPISA